jgi:Tol biopolymer transport system component/imidazolonepropionase-like amidohydrolase
MKTWIRVLSLGLVAALAVTLPLTADAKKKKDKAKADEKEEQKWDVSNPPGEWVGITIDTKETTWSDVDVSPDGRTIVFDMLGDIYAVPLAGGEATALTDGIAWNFQPRFSPDGKQIAFISDRAGGDNLWVMNADGSDPRAISEEKEHLVHNPAWSPDGEFIAAKKGFTSTRSIPAGEIWLFHVGGGGGLQITERPHKDKDQKTMAEPAFSPDGRYIYYSQDTTPGRVWQYNKDSTGSIFSIQRLDRVKGETDRFVSGPGGAVRPTPSPDGKYLAFVKRIPGLTSALYLKDLDSGKEWAVYSQMDRDLQETNGSQGNSNAFAWMPDSKSIVFWAGGKIRRVDVDSREASVIPVHVKATKKVHPALRFPIDVAPDRFRVKMIRWAQMSPQGDKVLFQALGHLYVRDAAGGEPRRLTSQSEHFEFWPSFSPDGRSVVYTTWDDQDLGSVRIVPIGGGTGRVITDEPGHYIEPRFSPDGYQVVYRKITGGFMLSPLWSVEPGIYRVYAGGGESVRLSKSGFDAQFDPSGERVIFSDVVEDTQLVLKSVNLDGHDERTHLQGKEATEFRVSPDGRWVAFTEDYNAYVAPFTPTGRKVSVGSGSKSIPVKQVSKRSGEFLHWSADSAKLHWAHGATLYTRELKDAFGHLSGFPEELPEPVESGLDLGFEVAADKPSGTVVLRGGRVVTMRDAGKPGSARKQGTGEVIDNGVVVIEGNRITAVGAAGDVAVPHDAKVLDVSGHTIIPGLVDVHAHGSMGRSEITPQQNWAQYSYLAFGVTTVHDPSNDTTEIFAAAEMQRSGVLVGPRVYSTGTILYGAHVPGYKAKIGSLDDAKFHVQRLKDVGAISVKSYQQPRRDQRQQVIAAARELGIMVVPEGGAKFQHNMNEIVDGHTGIEHALSLAHVYDDVLQLWSQTEVGYTPTFGVAYGGLSGELYWYDRTDVWENERLMRYSPRFIIEPRSIRRPKAPDSHYNHIEIAKHAKQMLDRGVDVNIGAHGQREGLAAHWEMWMMHQGGFTPWEAIRGATHDGAWYVGLDGDVGSIEPGKLADLVVIDGNPLEDLRRSEYVAYTVINGRVYEAATMNQVAPDAVAREPFFFEQEGGDTIHPATQEWLEQKQERYGWVH